MGVFEVAAILITLAALFSWINHRFVRLPGAIGIMAIALAFSLAVLVLSRFNLGLEEQARRILASADLEETLLHGMLGFLLFAGALFIDINDLVAEKWAVAALATGGMIVSTLVIGGLAFVALQSIGFEASLLYCLAFGALISPTDPIAVLGILKRVGAPKSLETSVSGESLFNDGVGVVLFFVLLELATGSRGVSAGRAALLLLEETGGGVLLGLALGVIAYQMLKRVDEYRVEIMVTLALVTGGYALAEAIHVSGPIAMVVAGLLIGNHGRAFAMSDRTRERLDAFWELVDEILNAVLFLLLGLEVIVIPSAPKYLLVGIVAIPIVLFARLVSVVGVVGLLRFHRQFPPGAVRILVWGGLRGGIAVALALSLPPVPERTVLLAATYAVVVFSIIVQGLTIGPMIGRIAARGR